MKSILILAFNDLRHDARVARQVHFLSDRAALTVVCFDAPKEWSHEIIRIDKIRPGFVRKVITAILLLTRFYRLAYRLLYDFPKLRSNLQPRSFDLIVANDIECLPLAVRLRKKAKILYDAHEYAPRHFEDKKVWRIFFQRFNQYLCTTYLPMTDFMITVGQGLAREYATHFPVNPEIITNANYFVRLPPSPLAPGKIRLVHHGAANPSRQIELMIQMMDYLDDRFELYLMLLVPALANPTTSGYVEVLRKLVAGKSRIHLMAPVDSDKVLEAIHPFDIGVFLLPPVNFNYANTLPNKFFDFVQARLAIAIGPTPEMAELVTKHTLGVVAEDFTPEALARKLNALSESDIVKFKENSDRAAQHLSAQVNREKLNKIITTLIGN